MAQNQTAYFKMLGMVLAQLDGMVLGYQARHKQAQDNSTVPYLSYREFLFLNGNGELYDIIPSLDPSKAPTYADMDADQAYAKLALAGRCSALIKATGTLPAAVRSSWSLLLSHRQACWSSCQESYACCCGNLCIRLYCSINLSVACMTCTSA